MILLALLGLVSLSSVSQAAVDFCTDPYAAICGAQDEIGKQYDARLAATKQGIRDQTERAVASKYGYSPADDSGYDAYAKAHPEAADRMLGDFLAFMRNGAMEAVGSNPLQWQSQIQDRVHATLFEVVDEQSALALQDKANFKAALSQLELVDAGAIIAAGAAHPLWPNFAYQCSVNGLRDNAFHPPDQEKLVLCPGLILAARSDPSLPADRQDMFPGVVWTMSHETGHSIDIGHFQPLYQKMSACVEDVYIRTGVLKGFEGLAAGSPQYDEKLEAHMEEIAADHWANEVMAKLVAEQGDRQRGLALLKAATVGLCGLRDDGARYGSDHFRIGMLAGRNPRLRQALGCEPLPADQPTCVF